MLLGARTAAWCGGGKGYGVDFVMNNFGQYVDTGFNPNFNNGFRIKMKFIPTKSGDRYVLASNYDNSSNSISYEINANNQSRIYKNGDISLVNAVYANEINEGEISYYNGVYSNTINGNTVITQKTETGNGPGSMFLFIDRILRYEKFPCPVGIESCDIYDGSTKARCLKAALSESGEPCFYDEISKTYIFKLGTNELFGGRYVDDGTGTLKYSLIGPTITSINGGLFTNCIGIHSVGDLPMCETVMGWSFQSCTSMTQFGNLPSCTTLGNGVFYNCTSLQSVGDLSACTSIGHRAFYGCTSLMSISFSEKTIAEVKAMTNFPWLFTKSNNRINCSDGYTIYQGGQWVDHYN